MTCLSRMNPCFCFDLRKGCMIAGVWTCIYSLVFMAIFAWQLGMVNSCEDSLAEFVQLFDFCHQMNDVTNCPCRHSMTIASYENLLSGLFAVQMVAVVTFILLLFSSACLVWAVSESVNRYWYWPWFVSCAMNIFVMLCYCIMWWAGHAEGYWIALTFFSFFFALINVYCIFCVVTYYLKIKQFHKQGGYQPDSLPNPSSELRNFLTTEYDSSNKPVTVLNYEVSGCPTRNVKSIELNLKPPDYYNDSGYESVRGSSGRSANKHRYSPNYSPNSKSPSNSLESKDSPESDKVDIKEIVPQLPIRRNTGSSVVKLATSKRSIDYIDENQRFIDAIDLNDAEHGRSLVIQHGTSIRSNQANIKSSSSPTLDRCNDLNRDFDMEMFAKSDYDRRTILQQAKLQTNEIESPNYDQVRPLNEHSNQQNDSNLFERKEDQNSIDSEYKHENTNFTNNQNSENEDDDFDYINNDVIDLDYDVPPPRLPTSPVSPASTNSNDSGSISRRNTPRGRKNNRQARYIRRRDSTSPHVRSTGRHHRSKSPRQHQIEQLHRKSSHFDEQSQVCNCDKDTKWHEEHLYGNQDFENGHSDFVDAMTGITVVGGDATDLYDVPKSLKSIAV